MSELGPTITKLEPTITEHEPTATERLRALLDERGVEWEDMSIRPYACTSWRDPDGEPCTALEGADDIPDGKLSAQALLTPEQAIATTLGQEDVYTREDMEGAFVSGYSLGSLPVGSDPRWDENRQTVDEHMAELGWVRKEAATLDDSDDGISEMEWGSDEHLDGLSRDALKSEVRWWHGRALEMETENTKLIELVRELYEDQCIDGDRWKYRDRMRELGVDDG